MPDNKNRKWSALCWFLAIVVVLGFFSVQLLVERRETTRKKDLVLNLTLKVQEYALNGDYQDALFSCEMILGCDPENTKALHIKAFVYKEQGNYEESLVYYQKALDINQSNGIENPGLYVNLADLYIATEHYQEAVHYWQKAKDVLETIEIKTPDELEILMRVYHHFAYYNLDLDHKEKALEYFAKCLECIDKLFDFRGPPETFDDLLRDAEMSITQLAVLHDQELLYSKLGRTEDAAKVAEKIDDLHSGSKLERAEQLIEQ